MKVFLSIIISFVLCVPPVFAQVDTADFSISFFGGADSTPPSTPTLLTVVPVAATQIDIDWSVSVDDFVIGGYVVFRDGVSIATTTLTSYSDTGLLASTSYQYGVQAFDGAFNYSSTSNLLSTTTIPTPIVVSADPGGGGNQGTVARVVLRDFEITTSFSTTLLSITTARPSQFQIRWGRTTSYELGYIATNRFADNYKTTLTDLEPGTTYEYEVIGLTPLGIETVLSNGTFTTLETPQVKLPPNVNRFTGEASNTDIALSWQLPDESNIAYVRIVRNHLGFPSHPQDGAVLYEGSGQSFLDKNILAQYSPVYYTAFAYDSEGNVSSGAITVVYAPGTKPVTPAESESPAVGGEDLVTDPAVVVITRDDINMPDVSEIYIMQGDAIFSLFDKQITLDAHAPFTFSIPKDAIANNLKSIIVSLSDPTDSRKRSSFLLRINKDTTAYEALIAPLALEGRSNLTIEIYDFESLVVATYKKVITFTQSELHADTPRPITAWRDVWTTFSLFIILLLLLTYLFFIFWRRRSPHEDNL